MPIVVTADELIVGDLKGEIARLKSLVNALQQIADGEFPSDQELATAPLLIPYAIATRSLPCLVGRAHTGSGIRPAARTSEVWAIAPVSGWALTYDRFYRLGEPMLTRPRPSPPDFDLARGRA